MKKLKTLMKKVDKPEEEEVVVASSSNHTLRDAIDTDKLFTMIYSGVENEKYFKVLYDLGIRDFLISYEYVKSKNLPLEKYKQMGVKFFIDSGAYTYMGKEEYKDYTIEDWEKQIKSYLAWARANRDIIFAIANLDLEMLVGEEQVRKWNAKYFEPFMLETNIPVCFIWHTVSGEEGWEYYCKRYPYVGFSWVSDTKGIDLDFNFGQRMLRVAEKHKAVVHGMGMTRTALLPKLPFYTCDSTTWLVGLQYGEVNYWRGKKMSRLKKEDWKGEYLSKILNQFSQYNLDRDKLLNEDPEELIKVNVLAFVEAQEYIRHKLKKKMYWLKPDIVANDRNSIDIFDKFPSPEWIIEGKTDDWETYCKNLNIGIEDTNLALLNLVDCACFCQWENPDLEDYLENTYTEEVIKELHDKYINRITDGVEQQIEDLQNFFWECVEGKNDTLLLAGSNFDRKAKERDNYIEEDEDETVDVDKEELVRQLASSNLLTEGNEIDELDDEIFSNVGIQPVRDSKGRFLKGQKKVRKPKNIYSKKYPKLACDTCYAAQTCPDFKAGYVCAYNKMFKRFDSRNLEDIVDAMQSMVNLNMERMQRVAIFEMLDGGMPDGNLTNMIDQNMRLLMNLKQMQEAGAMQVLKKTTVINSDGSSSETVQVNSPASGGILEKLMEKSLARHQGEETEKEKKEDPNIVKAEYHEI